jgi:hypothetical protein
MLDLCKKHDMKIDLCLGPFQYPYYPGIYFPKRILNFVFDTPRSLDTTGIIWDYGIRFLEVQMQSFGNDKRINGFHLANEWPDKQNVTGKENIKNSISLAFMLFAADYLYRNTDKPISLNTNISVYDRFKLKRSYKEIMDIFGKRGRLGFDIYPSQITWKKTPVQKLKKAIFNYPVSFRAVKKIFPSSMLYFAEIEAQPWGGGQSWYQLIRESKNPQQRVRNYTRDSLNLTFRNYVFGTSSEIVSLWGSDFWLSADAMDVKWPLDMLRNYKHNLKV